MRKGVIMSSREDKKVSGKRIYVTFLHGGTIALHPSNCTGERYRMKTDGSKHVSSGTSDEELGKLVRAMLNECKTE